MTYWHGDSLDGVRDAIALVKAALEDDHPAAQAILDGGDLRDVVWHLAGYAAAATVGNHGTREAALEWLAGTLRELAEAEAGQEPA